MTVVTLAMQDPAAAREFYLTKLGFTASKSNPMLLNLPGTSGQMVEIVPADPLGSKSSIVLTTPDLDKTGAAAERQQVAFKRGNFHHNRRQRQTRSEEMLTVTDPDGNILRIVGA